MFEYCYLYVEKGVSCVSDVIRIRRKMLGMSVAKLSDGICTERTLRRIENRQSTSQMAIVTELFGRLGLSPELTRTDLVTEKPEARQLMEKFINKNIMNWFIGKSYSMKELKWNENQSCLISSGGKSFCGAISGSFSCVPPSGFSIVISGGISTSPAGEPGRGEPARMMVHNDIAAIK